MKTVAPIYFSKHSTITSLYRQLNLWGFERVGKTRQRNSAWKHKFFLRHDIESVNLMKRCAVKNNTSKYPRPLTMKSKVRTVSEDTGPTMNRSVSVVGIQEESSSQRITPAGVVSECYRDRSTSERGNNNVKYSKTKHDLPFTPNTTLYDDLDPLLDEKLGYEHYLGQDFKSYMSVLDKNLDVNKLNAYAIDTNIDFTLVFQK
mmetsp:Transcript_12220/g.24975  ORF Transcript_12220/g.24975 Transcript_12220/m.24975 type:complete len:203 (-) Transcript_12220:199-807(-)